MAGRVIYALEPIGSDQTTVEVALSLIPEGALTEGEAALRTIMECLTATR